MIWMICGKSGSGKNTVLNELCNERDYDRIITYTTRPMRSGERDGVDYNFVSDRQFEKMTGNHEFAEYKSYNPAAGGTWSYGSKITDEQLNDDRNHFIILTPAGIRDVKKYFGNNERLKTVYLEVARKDLERRLEARGDDPEEIQRRLDSDDRDFTDMENKADLVIKNDRSIENTVKRIESTIYDTMSLAEIHRFIEENRAGDSTGGSRFELTDPSDEKIYAMAKEMTEKAVQERDGNINTSKTEEDIADNDEVPAVV